MLALTLSAAALLVSVLSAGTSFRQLREAKKANAFPATVDLFREYRRDEMVAARRLLSQRLRDLRGDNVAIADLPDDVANAALKIAHYLDNLGVQVQHGLISPPLVAGFLGDSALRLWLDLEPFIRAERERRSPKAFLQYFEHLAVVLRELQPAQVRASLRSWVD